MSYRQRIDHLVLIAILPLASLAGADDIKVVAPAPNYNDHIKPIVRQHCLKCHGEDTHKADINLQAYPSLLRGGVLAENNSLAWGRKSKPFRYLYSAEI